MSSAICFSLDQSRILSSSNELSKGKSQLSNTLCKRVQDYSMPKHTVQGQPAEYP